LGPTQNPGSNKSENQKEISKIKKRYTTSFSSSSNSSLKIKKKKRKRNQLLPLTSQLSITPTAAVAAAHITPYSITPNFTY
jgi:hypothetical protein